MHSLLDLKLADELNRDRLAAARAQGQRAARLARVPRRNRPSRPGSATESR